MSAPSTRQTRRRQVLHELDEQGRADVARAEIRAEVPPATPTGPLVLRASVTSGVFWPQVALLTDDLEEPRPVRAPLVASAAATAAAEAAADAAASANHAGSAAANAPAAGAGAKKTMSPMDFPPTWTLPPAHPGGLDNPSSSAQLVLQRISEHRERMSSRQRRPMNVYAEGMPEVPADKPAAGSADPA